MSQLSHISNATVVTNESRKSHVPDESFLEWIMSQLKHVQQMRHATNGSHRKCICHYKRVLSRMSHIAQPPVATNNTCRKWFMSRMSSVTNESSHEWVKSHISQMSPLITSDSCRKRVMSRTSSVTNKSRHVLSRISHVTSCHEWVMSNSAMEESRHEPGLTERRRGCAGLTRTKLALFTCTLSLRNMSAKSTAASSCVSTHNI